MLLKQNDEVDTYRIDLLIYLKFKTPDSSKVYDFRISPSKIIAVPLIHEDWKIELMAGMISDDHI